MADSAPLYILPFDHRESFEHGLFGWTGDLSSEQTARIVAAKRLIYAALLRAIDGGVSKDRAALLVDEHFGREILLEASARGLTTACPVEKSGNAEFEFEYGEDYVRHIEAMDPTYCKVLVRYNPQGDAALNLRQAGRLRRLSTYLHQTERRFLFELLVPAEPEQLARLAYDANAYDLDLRPSLMVAAMRELQDEGVEPDVWKVEGLDRRQDGVAVVQTAQSAGRRGVTCIVLGRHSAESRTRRWLEVAASIPGFNGFAVGRSTFWEPIELFLAGGIGSEDAEGRIARAYRHWVDVWETARRQPLPDRDSARPGYS